MHPGFFYEKKNYHRPAAFLFENIGMRAKRLPGNFFVALVNNGQNFSYAHGVFVVLIKSLYTCYFSIRINL